MRVKLYLDGFFLINTGMNLVVFLTQSLLMQKTIRLWRLILASILGAVMACLLVLFHVHRNLLLLVLSYFFVSVFLVRFAFGKMTTARTVMHLLLYYACAFILAGLLLQVQKSFHYPLTGASMLGFMLFVLFLFRYFMPKLKKEKNIKVMVLDFYEDRVLFSKCMKGAIDPTVSLVIAVIIGAAVAAVFGVLIGIPVLRLKGDYLAIVTLAFGEIIKNLINVMYVGLDSNGFHFSIKDTTSLGMGADGVVIIKGAQGITGTPKAATFTVGIILVLITLFIVLNLINSRTGRAIMSIRDNRIAAESVGINITKYKLMAFAISAALAGVAGVLYAHNLSSLAATPKNFGYNMSIMILVFVVLGGLGNIRGSMIAAIILTMLPELLRGLNDYRMLIYAIVLIVMMLFNWAPKAIEWREKHLAKFKQKKAVKEEA